MTCRYMEVGAALFWFTPQRHSAGGHQLSPNHTKAFLILTEVCFRAVLMAGFKRLGQTQECLVTLHSRITVLTSDILKICILKGRCKSRDNFAFKCSTFESPFFSHLDI